MSGLSEGISRLLLKRRTVYILLFCCTVILYIGSLANGYVFDDRPLFHNNRFVMQGIAGIPDIMTTDAFTSQYLEYGSTNKLGGGRYRPLSMVTFALEAQLFGLSAVAWFSHLMNVLIYAVAVLLVLCFAERDLFPGRFGLCVLIASIFAFHPIHTEVVLNVKSRDELLCMAFMLLCLRARNQHWILPALFFALAILSKEYAVTLLLLLPALQFVRGEIKRGWWKSTLSVAVTFFFYLCARIQFVGVKPMADQFTILNYPYLYAEGTEHPATLIYVLGLYLGKLVWPHPLAYDYSYNHVPYQNFGSPGVWLSLIAYVMLSLWLLSLMRRKSPLCIAVLMFFGTLFLVSNIVFNTGQMMSERFLFHPSLGFSIVSGWWIVQLASDRPKWRKTIVGLSIMLLVFSVVRVVSRIPDWRSEEILYKHDVVFLPGNTLANCNAAAKYMDQYYGMEAGVDRDHVLNKALYHANRSLSIYPEDEVTQMNLGLLHFNRGEYEMADRRWDLARQYVPDHPTLEKYGIMLSKVFLQQGIEWGRSRQYVKAANLFRKAIKNNPFLWDAYYFLGGALAESNDLENAMMAWESIRPVSWLGFDEDPEYKVPE